MVRRFLFAASLVLGATACQRAVSVEEAKTVAPEFSTPAPGFVPPPRTIEDITAILDQQQRLDPAASERDRRLADTPPPETDNRSALADFLYERALAARRIGRMPQELEDLKRAASYHGGVKIRDYWILRELAVTEWRGGDLSRALDYYRRAREAASESRHNGALVIIDAELAAMHAWAGDMRVAEAAETRARQRFEGTAWHRVPPSTMTAYHAKLDRGQASVLRGQGRLTEAERAQRVAIQRLERDTHWSRDPWLEQERTYLAWILIAKGRLLEAESESRRALLGILSKRGRDSAETAYVVRMLTTILSEQGRYAEAESLGRALLDIYTRIGAPEDSLSLNLTRISLAVTLTLQGRPAEALKEYEQVRVALTNDAEATVRVLRSGWGYGVALMLNGRHAEAIVALTAARDHWRTVLGERHAVPALIQAYIATARARSGDLRFALNDFREAIPRLLGAGEPTDIDEDGGRSAADKRLAFVVGAYMDLLAEIRGTSLERQSGIDATAEAFRLAEVLRGGAVGRALDASASRALAATPALADLVRREQDARKRERAAEGALRNALSIPSQEQDPATVSQLRQEISNLRVLRVDLADRIRHGFPAYAELVAPPATRLDQARAALRSDEALISIAVLPRRTLVWAARSTGPVAFAAVPLDFDSAAAAVRHLRRALAPDAPTLGDIPTFDVGAAHTLYRTLLEPVAAGWAGAASLLVVSDGALAQLPFALLVTKPATLAAESGALFSNYRDVPWLIRSHAVTILPSAGSLETLRRLPPGDASRRAFVGFGDPYFSREQARRADVAAVPSDGVPLSLRNLKVERANSAQLGMLPRLPDTAPEILGIAQALNADPARDVFLGARANERQVRTMNLAMYRVIAFATHGLVPGELDGLTQPALALSAPDVAGVDGDGLLTMDKILGLRLNADWVVLSACNTASADGAGAEAVSGLGRAFFYAGARALLVSNWPVETTSARALTTELFRRHAADPRLSRARVLQQTLIALIDDGGARDARSGRVVFSYAHPIFWAPFTLVGDGG